MARNRTKHFAGLLLLIFLAQCIWLIHVELRSEYGCYPAGTMERQERVLRGLAQWRGQGIAGTPGNGEESFRGYDRYRSSLWYLTAAAPVIFGPAPVTPQRERIWLWLTRVPYLISGVLLGASLWYVTRRLYGNAGGLIALVLYCFSPGIIQSSSELCRDAEIGAAWGAFGAVFTAIALAHTLYAPREVVLWNWRRITLLGISLALAAGSQFSLAVMVPLTLGFLFYLAPQRRLAAAVIWTAAFTVAGLLLLASYFFHLRAFWEGLRAAKFVDTTPSAFAVAANYQRAITHILRASPLLVVFLPVVLLTYLLWRRARYFGNSAPLLVAVLCVALAVAAPDFPGQGFLLVAMPFLFASVAGVFADLIETRRGATLQLVLGALLSAYALWNVVALGMASG